MSKYRTHREIIDEIRLKCARAYWCEDSLHPNGNIPKIKCLEPHKLATLLDAANKRERNRNFHRFATAEEAAKAWNELRFKDLCVVCAGCTFDRGPEGCAPGANCEIGWLYAEAQEGGANG